MHSSLTVVATLLVLLVGCHHGFVFADCPQGYNVVDEHCFKVSLHYLDVARPISYQEAKRNCQRSLSGTTSHSCEWTANLVELDDSEKLEALSRHVFEDLPKAMSGLVFWVGGEYLNGVWKWVDGSKVNLRSNIFLPGQPPAISTNMSLYLVPADRINQRLYVMAQHNYKLSPSYVCEATED